MRWARSMSWLPVALCAWASSSCAPSGFQDASQVTSVRILASTADKPYTKPGDTVNLTVLAVDGRTSPAVPMTVYWLPFVCENPLNDAYFGCFQQIASGGSAAGADGGTGAAVDSGGGFAAGDGGAIKAGVELMLPTGPTYTFTMPSDAVTSHPATPGISVPYGLAILFNIACAGHIEILPVDPSNANPQRVPIGCFDANHNQLGPDDWVFGFTRVYAYDDVTNANPVVSSVDLGATMPVAVTGPPPAYTASTLDTQLCTGNCKTVKVGPSVQATSWEIQSQLGPGTQTHEEIWADFFATFGKLDNGARLLYDSTRGQLGGGSVTDNAFTPPSTATPSDGTLWIVVHDNRGGASWITVPVHVM